MLIEIGSRPVTTDARRALDSSPLVPRPRLPREFQTLPTKLTPLAHHWYLPCKAVIEWCAALILFAFMAPLILLGALLVKLTSPGPAFYTQARVGRNGRLFTIYKLRTMIHNCESLTGARWSLPGDPRVTPVGWFLRMSHLDELPQLVNVLRGDMSLIGPRPERPEFIPELERALPEYRQRLAVRPGVTGLAQVRQAADTDLDSVRRKLAYDLYYIRHLSPWLELRILAGTALYTLGDPGNLSRKLRLVPGDDKVSGALIRNGSVREALAA